MIIETKEVVTLMKDEKVAINTTYRLMLDILEQISDPDIYNAAKQACNGLEEFGYLVDTEVK